MGGTGSGVEVKMGRRKKNLAVDSLDVPPADPKTEHINQVDTAVRAIEQRYGPGRLMAACPDLDLAEKMRRQITKYSEAVWEGTVDDVRVHGAALIRGYQALEKVYLASFEPLDHSKVIEAPLGDGSVLAIVADITGYKPAPGDQRAVLAIGAETVAQMWDEQAKKTLGAMAQHFPGAKIESVTAKLPEDDIPF